jgi:sugar lactone lactonase YvrE
LARDSIYRISLAGDVDVFSTAFGRPQGLAFDKDGSLYVADALAGNSGIYRIRADVADEPELMLSGGSILGLAFDPGGGVVLASSDTVYRLNAPLHGLLYS